jgi:hypothetical protein
MLALDDRQARAAGQLCGLAGSSDAVDAQGAVAGRESAARVITSDPQRLLRLDPRLELVTS